MIVFGNSHDHQFIFIQMKLLYHRFYYTKRALMKIKTIFFVDKKCPPLFNLTFQLSSRILTTVSSSLDWSRGIRFMKVQFNGLKAILRSASRETHLPFGDTTGFHSWIHLSNEWYRKASQNRSSLLRWQVFQFSNKLFILMWSLTGKDATP